MSESHQEAAALELGKHIVDRELLDRDGRRAGKADDLLLEIAEHVDDGSLPPPRVVGIISGPFAFAQTLPRPIQWLTRHIERSLGLANPLPVLVPWERVRKIDVVVHLDIDRGEAGLDALPASVSRRFIERLPGA